MDRISLVWPQAITKPSQIESNNTATIGYGSIPAASDASGGEGDQRSLNKVNGKMSGAEEKGASNGRVSSLSITSSSALAGNLPEYLTKEVMKITARSAGELETVWAQVGSHDSDTKMSVVNQMLSAVKSACEACVKQEKEARDSFVAHINQAKGDILELSRKLGLPTPKEGESTEAFFYGTNELTTLFDRLATLEMTLDALRAQQGDRSRTVGNLVEEMKTINDNMDREPEEGEFEESGGPEWKGKEGWELSEDRVEKLRKRLATLRVLKFERATEMVELLLDCQKLFRQLGLLETNPLHTKMLMSFDPSSPRDRPSLRTEHQTQTSVGLSAINVNRLKKMREEMQEDLSIHRARKEEHRRQIGVLWNKLNIPKKHREEHLAATENLTHTDMDRLEAELARLRKLKAEKLTDMLKVAREDIAKLLEVVGAKAEEVLGESARDLHVPPDDWTEELLEGHEEFLTRLRAMEEAVTPIVERVKKREELVQKREHLDSFKVDYRARGSGVLSQAKVIDGIKKELKKLPPITEDLRKRLRDWKETEGFPFRYNGREYLKVIEESDMQWQHRRETNRRARNGNGNVGHIGNGSNHGNGNGSDAGSSHGAPSSPTRAAINGGVFHSTGSMAFGGGGTPSHHRQPSVRLGGVGTASGACALFGTPSPRAVGGGGVGWGSGAVYSSTLARTGSGRGGSGGGSSSSSALSANGGLVVDSRGSGPQAQAGEKSAAARVAGGVGSGGVGARATGGGGPGESNKDPASKSLPCTPRKEARNPLLTSFTPSPTLKGLKQKALGGVFASTGGSHRLPPPPLPARPPTVETSQAFARMKSSPELLRAASASAGGQGVAAAVATTPAPASSGSTKIEANVGSGPAFSGSAGSMPPPLPARPARPSSAVFDRADLQAIRESTASSLRSSASASDVLSGGRRTEAAR